MVWWDEPEDSTQAKLVPIKSKADDCFPSRLGLNRPASGLAELLTLLRSLWRMSNRQDEMTSDARRTEPASHRSFICLHICMPHATTSQLSQISFRRKSNEHGEETL